MTKGRHRDTGWTQGRHRVDTGEHRVKHKVDIG